MQQTHLKLVQNEATPVFPHPRPSRRRPLGQILVDRGALSVGDLATALAIKTRQDCRLSDILLAHRMVSEADLFAGLEQQWGANRVDLTFDKPDTQLVQEYDLTTCRAHEVVPWKRMPGGTVFVSARPDLFTKFREALPDDGRQAYLALGQQTEVHTALMRGHEKMLTEQAEARVPEPESCRRWNTGRLRIATGGILCLLAIGAMTSPAGLFAVVCAWAVLTMVLTTGLKLAAAITQLRHARDFAAASASTDQAIRLPQLPCVSILVPLFREKEIAAHLIRRLKRLNYPKELLDICLVVEADDVTTHDTLTATRLPYWVRTITVPDGQLRTKPRAMNFALDFCKGSIIGIYDAEDAPDPDQVHKIVRRFRERGPEVACLQGILDYYNARTNWLSRCFTIEYATWFRIVLPGLVKLGFAIPLGGTTLFFRREALEKLGGWDAHNVTEDADLGIRLARHGYRAELIETVTEEEANCRVVPWIKQRSRWLKGYAATWAVHMRSPRRLLKQLGWWRFFGVQLLFVGTLSQFVLAPILWSFWLVIFGLPHPLTGVMPGSWFAALGALFLLTEAINIAVGMIAVSSDKHRFLRWWVPTLHFYFPLGALASYKGLYELLTRPFYWDKTSHGVYAPTRAGLPSQD
ncbi:glycosyltransferase family 2 protein [Aliiroseovarius sp. YM-037]|uniref:glycosyltransferase family 2 protein n=1 Tax=Aliiroseovarius sp. YM-037 TaxID=3341728 RepID=UPI003A80999D